MNTAQQEVLRNIMYAVETGGQVYGERDYADFTEAYTNSSSEHAITIGAGQWYATEAQKLLRRIQQTDSALFLRMDTAGIAIDLVNADWTTYKVSKGSPKANCIVSIIDTPVGHNCQDAQLDEQMAAYVHEAYTLGVISPRAQGMCANFRHQGGKSAMVRILNKTPKPYTLDNLYEACKTDTGNQVGAYKSRQKFVYENLIKYMADTEGALKVITVAQAEVGYLEKKTNSQLEEKTANAGFNNYTKYGRDMGCNGEAWCDAFVDWCFVGAYGRDSAKALLGGFSNYTPTSSAYFKNMGQWTTGTPKPGDVIFFHNSVRINHTGLVYKVEGSTVYTVEGNTSAGTAVIPNGGGVYEKSYAMSNARITGYGQPDYSLVGDSGGGGGSAPPPPIGSGVYLIRFVPE